MASHTITILFEDGRSVRIPGDDSQTVYLSCLMNKVRIQTDCMEGDCATCKALCTAGVYAMDDYSELALSAEEAAKGYVLPCQMQPKSDCVLEFPYQSSLALKSEPQTIDTRVSKVEQVSSTVYRLELAALAGSVVDFLPGQYVHLEIPGSGQFRSYSFANAPGANGVMVFYIKLLEHGVMSDYIANTAKLGDSIPMTGPFGRFYLRTPTRPILMIAGGTGLAPMLSMLDHLSAGGGTGQSIHLLCGANSADELFCCDQLAGFSDLETEFAVLNGGQGWDGATGHVTGLLRPELISRDSDIYLCGPPPMIEAGESWLAANGVQASRIHAERFLAS